MTLACENIKPRMTNTEAAELLKTLMFTTSVSGLTRVAIDKAIAALTPDVVPTIDGLFNAVVQATGVTCQEMTIPDKSREYAEARWIFAWLAYNYAGSSLTTISKRLNRVSHVTALHGIRRVDEWMSNPKINPDGKKLLDDIIERIVQ